MVKIKKIDHNAFEPLIIYKCLLDASYLGTIVEYLKPEYFSNENIKNVIQIITDFYKKTNESPTITEIKTYLVTDKQKESWKNVVESFNEIDKNLNIKELYENTELFLQEKAVGNTIMEVIEQSEKAGINTSELLEKFQNACSISLTHDLGLNYLQDIEKFITEITKTENYISSGYKWIDEVLGGGFLQEGKALYVFSGQTNVGKSIVLGNMASNICAQGKTVLLVSLEMSEIVYAKRLCGNFANIPAFSLKHKLDELRDEIAKYVRENPKSQLIIKEFAPKTISVSNLTAYIKKLVQSGIKPDAIIVDYVNLFATNFGNNSYEQVKHITELLRAVSYIFNVPVITATQLNRNAINQSNPGLETMSESLGLAMTADCIFSIWREKEDEELGRINLSVQKNRQGPAFGTASFAIDYTTMRIREEAKTQNIDAVVSTEATLNEIME
jgi:replicative DNA helicase